MPEIPGCKQSNDFVNELSLGGGEELFQRQENFIEKGCFSTIANGREDREDATEKVNAPVGDIVCRFRFVVCGRGSSRQFHKF